MAYTTIDKPSDYFNTLTWTGADTSAGRDFIGVGFQPDLVWVKTRSVSNGHKWFDSVRGVGKSIQSEGSGAETTNDGNGYIDSFDSDGFSSIAGSSNNYNFNNTSTTIVAWNWKAGTSFTNDASATGIGTIDSTGSVNDTAGFSIVSYTGTGSAGTIKHGLSSVPYMMIIKKRNSATGSNWMVYHKSISGTGDGHLWLDLTNGRSTDTNSWNNTAPTSSVFSIGTRSENNGSGDTFIAYCFSEVKSFSKFSSYTGNGNADGTFIYTGFKPALFLLKANAAGENWRIFDNKRSTFNPNSTSLQPNSSNAEASNTDIDFCSNGIKLRTTSGEINPSGTSFIYMAFSSSPFTTSTGIPTTAV